MGIIMEAAHLEILKGAKTEDLSGYRISRLTTQGKRPSKCELMRDRWM